MAHTSTEATVRRRALLLAVVGVALAPVSRAASGPAVEVWKDPSCGCCKEWVQHLEAHGFRVTVHDTGNNAVRTRLGIDRKYGSCHTALVGGYAIEGHVPAQDILRLLKLKPQALGLAVPGMPVGSPGMDGAIYKGRKDAFDVLLLSKSGSASVFHHYEGSKS
jgi:hypothetical protein